MALTTIDVHGEILEPVTNTPAVGTVTFKILQDLRDTVDNIVYSPQTFTATLDASGEFTITLPTTDNPDITPLDWTYWVYVDTDVWNSGVFYMALPAALGPVAEFADIIPILSNDCTPDGTACAPISLVGELATLQGEVDALESDVTTLQSEMITAQANITSLQATEGALVATVNIHTGQINAIQANTGLVGPTAFVNMTPVHANIILGSVAAATRLDRGADNGRIRGFLQATGVVPASAVLANIGTVAHRPLHNVNLGVRYTAGSSRLQVLTNGDVTLGSALALNDQVWLDSTTYDLIA